MIKRRQFDNEIGTKSAVTVKDANTFRWDKDVKLHRCPGVLIRVQNEVNRMEGRITFKEARALHKLLGLVLEAADAVV